MVTNFWMQKKISTAHTVYRYEYPSSGYNDPGEYIALKDSAGNKWAVYTDTTGSTAAPSGAVYAGIAAARKKKCDISAISDLGLICQAFADAFASLSGIGTYFTFSRTVINTVDFLVMTRVIEKTPAADDAMLYIYDDSTSWTIGPNGSSYYTG